MTNDIANAPRGVIASMAEDYGMDKTAFVKTIKATIMPGANVSDEQIAAFCLVARAHKLNPFTKEIFAFPSRGGIMPVVSVDGWMKLINSHPEFDGMTFVDTLDADGKLASVTCSIYRKDRSHPVQVTEYMSECRRGTDVWKQWPARMLRHKAAIQAARYAFGFAGIMEPDEVERMDDTLQHGHEVVGVHMLIDEKQQATLADMIEATGSDKAKFLELFHVKALSDLPASDYNRALSLLRQKERAMQGKQK